MKFTIAVGLCALLAACGNSDNEKTTTTNDSMNVNVYDTNHHDMVDTTHNTAITTVTIDPADTSFVSKAAMGGQAEVDLGNMANSQGASDRVKQFGNMMINDHTKVNNELRGLAGNIPMTSNMPKDMQATKDHLSKLNGSAFDKAYMTHMVSDHRKDIALFEKASKDAKTAAIKDFAARTLPTLKTHLDSALAVQKSLK
jgi:putative membrane protein